jgi:hypothetical protein
MRGMKYLVYEGAAHQMIVVFPSSVDHHAMVQMLGVPEDDLVSAGFIAENDGDNLLYCYGESVGLKLKSRNQADTSLLYRMLRN